MAHNRQNIQTQNNAKQSGPSEQHKILSKETFAKTEYKQSQPFNLVAFCDIRTGNRTGLFFQVWKPNVSCMRQLYNRHGAFFGTLKRVCLEVWNCYESGSTCQSVTVQDRDQIIKLIHSNNRRNLYTSSNYSYRPTKKTTWKRKRCIRVCYTGVFAACTSLHSYNACLCRKCMKTQSVGRSLYCSHSASSTLLIFWTLNTCPSGIWSGGNLSGLRHSPQINLHRLHTINKRIKSYDKSPMLPFAQVVPNLGLYGPGFYYWHSFYTADIEKYQH